MKSNVIIRNIIWKGRFIMNPIQRIPLEGLFNTRDLGGIETMDGYRVRPRRLIRSGQLYHMTENDKKVLSDEYGLKSIVDFRTLDEQAEKPDPHIEGATHISNPILQTMTAGITHDETSEKMTLEEATLAMKEHGVDPTFYMQKLYEDIITSDYSLKQYAQFFRILARQEEGATLWHCSAGKDRVGMGTAMLLYTLDVDMDTIIEDYMMTAAFLKDEVELILKRLSAAITDPGQIESLRICMGVKENYIKRVFQIMEETSGSIRQFLKDKIGLSESMADTLKGDVG